MFTRSVTSTLSLLIIAGCGAAHTGDEDDETSAAALNQRLPMPSVTAISPGNFNGCLRSGGGNGDGQVLCWGEAIAFDAPPTSGDYATPIAITGFPAVTITDVKTGGYGTCALTSAGGVLCWGDGEYGTLGDGTRNTRYTPAYVTGITSGATQIAMGEDFGCALVAGAVKCWGRYNWLGLRYANPFLFADVYGSSLDVLVPTLIPGMTSGVTQIAIGPAGNHVCAIVSGNVKCYGDNFWSQLGNGSTAQFSPTFPFDSTYVDGATSFPAGYVSTATSVVGIHGTVTAIALSFKSSCALTSSGTVYCWGKFDGGQDYALPSSPFAVAMPGMTGVTSLAVGDNKICFVTAGNVNCVGSWDPTYPATHTMVPTAVTGYAGNVDRIYAGATQFCAIMNDGGASCFGDNQANALGSNHNYDTGALISSATPLAVYGYAAGDTYPAPTYSPDTGFRIIQGPLSAIVTVGSAKTLTAYFDSSLMPAGSIVPTTASWSLNGTPLRTTPIARGSTGPLATSLVLTDLTEKDMGVYQVTVNYTGGQLTDFASLQTAY